MAKRVGAKTQPCLTPLLTLKDRCIFIDLNSPIHVLVKRNCKRIGGQPIFFQYLKERFPAHSIKGFRQIKKGDEQWFSLFPAFFLQLAQCKDHISRWSTGRKSSLCLWQHAIGQPLQVFQKAVAKILPNTERRSRYSPIIILVALFSICLVQGNDFGVPRFVFDSALSPALQQQCMHLRENIFIYLKNFRRNTIFARRFPLDSALIVSESSSSVGSSSKSVYLPKEDKTASICMLY